VTLRLFELPEPIPPITTDESVSDFEVLDQDPPLVNNEPVGDKEVVIDWVKANLVLGRLMLAYENNEFPYSLDSVRLPHDPRHMPETLPRGGTEHAMFLWTSCYYMRGGIKSVAAFQLLSNVYDDSPGLFDAETAAEEDPEYIGDLLKSHRLGYRYTQIGNFWVENAKRLHKRWDGDPRNIFDGVSDYETSLKRIQNDFKGGGFQGFQEKMVSMITYYLMDEGLIEPYVFPLPVDLHVMRVATATEMLKFEGYEKDENILSKRALDMARQLFYLYARNNNIDTLRLCDAVWLLSNALCGIQPGNVTMEPKGRKNRNGRSTILVPVEVDTSDPKQQRDYRRSCQSCPIETECKWNVPGKIYYVQGELKRRGERVHFPERIMKLFEI
jgi:hypothetical protein